MTRAVDLIVVGQGIAGSALAWQAAFRDLSFVVVEPCRSITSSRIAAGLVTPITGKRLTRSEEFDEQWRIADGLYRQIERELRTSFWKSQTSFRFWRSGEERDRYRAKIMEFGSDHCVRMIDSWDNDFVNCPFGGFEMSPAGKLDVVRYLDASRAAWQTAGCFLDDELTEADVQIRDGSEVAVSIPRLGVVARWIVWCTGPAIDAMPWFGDLRLRPNQGDILTLQIPGMQEPRAIHAGEWLVQQSGDIYLAGATHRWSDFDPQPRNADRQLLEERIGKLIKKPFQVIAHRTAIRPASFDQQPLLGPSPRYQNAYVFTGLGSKGTLLAPWCSNILLDSMNRQAKIPDFLRYDR